jgi:hypothetical protein
MMGNKLLLTWNIRSQTQMEHFQRLREFVNKLPLLGLELKDAWWTRYGESPDILLGIAAQGSETDLLETAVTSEEWRKMLGELKEYISGYKQRIVAESEHFQF